MSVALLEKYLPENAFSFVDQWLKGHKVHLVISRSRGSKLGDYQKLENQSHKITVNYDLPQELFFFVLTHEIAHLIAFQRSKNKKIAPHGAEWKAVFRELLLESLTIYSEGLKPHILQFSKSPKANFMASGPIVRFFHQPNLADNEIFIESLNLNDHFLYKKQKFKILEKFKKNYLCANLQNGKKYVFKPLAKVEKLNDEQ